MVERRERTMSSDADDAASLRAALSVFDDWDSDLTALFQFSEDTSASYGRQAKPSKAEEPVVPYKPRRTTRKHEIAALRAHVDELETVVALKNELMKQQPPTDEAMKAVALRKEWERIAASQYEERQAAEVENAKLHKLADSHVKTAEQILKLMKRVDQIEDALPEIPPVVCFEDYIGPKADLHSQFRQLDAMLPRANELFGSGAFSTDKRNCWREVHFVDTEKDSRGVGVQFEASWLLPFEAERVADALWVHTVRRSYQHKKATYKIIHEDTHCLASQFMSKPASKDVWGSQGQIAARRVPRDLGDRSFLILLTMEARVYAGSTWKGSVSIEGWLRVESVFSEDERISRVKWSQHTLLQPLEAETMKPSELNKWVNGAISGATRSKFERDLEWSVQALENILVSRKQAA